MSFHFFSVEAVLFQKPRSGQNDDVTMTASAILNDTLTNQPIAIAIDFSIKNYIQEKLFPLDSLESGGYSVLFHQDNNTVFHHRYWDSSKNKEISWEDLEFNSTGNYTYSQRESFIKQLADSKAYALTGKYSIENQVNTSQFYQEWSRDQEIYISLVYPIEVSEDWSIFKSNSTKKQIMLFGKVFLDDRNLLDGYSVIHDPSLLVAFSVSIVFVLFLLTLGSLHFAAIIAFYLIIPIDSLIIFLQQNMASTIFDEESQNQEQNSPFRFMQGSGQDSFRKNQLKNIRPQMAKKQLNSSIDKNKNSSTQVHRTSIGNSPFLQQKNSNKTDRSRSESVDVTLRSKNFTQISFTHRLGVPLTQRKNLFDQNSQLGAGNLQLLSQRGSFTRIEEIRLLDTVDDPKQFDTLNQQQQQLTNVEQFSTLQGEKQIVLAKKAISAEQVSNYNLHHLNNNLTIREQCTSGGYNESYYTYGNSNQREEQQSIQQQPQQQQQRPQFQQSYQQLLSQQQVQTAEKQSIDNIKRPSINNFRTESNNDFESQNEITSEDNKSHNKVEEEIEETQKEIYQQPMFKEVQILWETFYLLHAVITYKSESFDKSVGAAQSILHFSKASKTFKMLQNSYGQAISLINLAHFQLIQEGQSQPQQQTCCGFPSSRDHCKGDSLGIETLEQAQYLILSYLGFQSLSRFEQKLFSGDIAWVSEQELILLDCLRTLLQMKGRYLRDISMPCSRCHQLSIGDSNTLKIARFLLRLALKLCSFVNIKKQAPEYILLRIDILELNLTLNPRHFSRDLIFHRALLKASCLVDVECLSSSTCAIKRENDDNLSMDHQWKNGKQLQQPPSSGNHLQVIQDNRFEGEISRRLASEQFLKSPDRYEPIQLSSRVIKSKIPQQLNNQPSFQHISQALLQWSSGIEARIQYLCYIVESVTSSFGSFKCLEQLTNILESRKYVETRILRRVIRAVSLVPSLYEEAQVLNQNLTRKLEQLYDVIVIADCQDAQTLLPQLFFLFSNNQLWDEDRVAVISLNQEELRVALPLVKSPSKRIWKATLEEVQKHIEFYNENVNNNTLTQHLKKDTGQQQQLLEHGYFPEEMMSLIEPPDDDNNYHNFLSSPYKFEAIENGNNLNKVKMSKSFSILAALEKALQLIPELGSFNAVIKKSLLGKKSKTNCERRALVILLSSFSDLPDIDQINFRLQKLHVHTEILHLRQEIYSSSNNFIKSNQNIVMSDQPQLKQWPSVCSYERYQLFSNQEQLLGYLQSLRAAQYRPQK